MTVRPVGAELFHVDTHGRMDGRTDRQTDRQTDMSRLVVAFRNFTNEPNMEFSLVYICK